MEYAVRGLSGESLSRILRVEDPTDLSVAVIDVRELEANVADYHTGCDVFDADKYTFTLA
jgi:hypothetical protein